MKVAGVWRYVYRASDAYGQVADVCLSERRDTEAAAPCFEQALAETEVRPAVVTADKAACSPLALERCYPRRSIAPGSWSSKGSSGIMAT